MLQVTAIFSVKLGYQFPSILNWYLCQNKTSQDNFYGLDGLDVLFLSPNQQPHSTDLNKESTYWPSRRFQWDWERVLFPSYTGWWWLNLMPVKMGYQFQNRTSGVSGTNFHVLDAVIITNQQPRCTDRQTHSTLYSHTRRLPWKRVSNPKSHWLTVALSDASAVPWMSLSTTVSRVACGTSVETIKRRRSMIASFFNSSSVELFHDRLPVLPTSDMAADEGLWVASASSQAHNDIVGQEPILGPESTWRSTMLNTQRLVYLPSNPYWSSSELNQSWIGEERQVGSTTNRVVNDLMTPRFNGGFQRGTCKRGYD